jgi:hypothetical protein
MVGNIVHRGVAEPTFRDNLKRMSDTELAGAARMYLWQRETAMYPYDEDAWRCECIKQECEERQKPGIFQLAENNILAQLRKNGCCG